MQTNKDIAFIYWQLNLGGGGVGNPMQTTFCFYNIEILAVQMTEMCTMLRVFYRRVPTNNAANNSVVGTDEYFRRDTFIMRLKSI